MYYIRNYLNTNKFCYKHFILHISQDNIPPFKERMFNKQPNKMTRNEVCTV